MKKILLLESDRSIAISVQDYLTPHGYKVAWSQTAEGAITAADKGNFVCVVTELALGAHSGIEFIHEFHSYTDFSNVPIIVFTSQHILDPVVLKGLGVVKYLYKPQTSLQQLLASINEHVK